MADPSTSVNDCNDNKVDAATDDVTKKVAAETSPPLSEKELLVKVEECMNAKDYENAADFGSSALQLLQQKNIALHVDSAQYYVVYGEALLRLIQTQNDIFGAPIREKQQEYKAMKEQTGDDIEKTENTNEEKDNDTEEIDDDIEKEENTNEEKGNDKEEIDDDDGKTDGSDEHKENEKETDEDHDTTEDRQIAWESFEAARVIIENHRTSNKDMDASYILILSQIHSFLGELALEEERHKFALSEFENSLKLQNECIKSKIDIHPRKKSFNHFMACLAAQFSELYDDALKHCKTALNELTDHIWQLMCQINGNESDKPNDITDSEMIKSAETLIASKKEKMSEEEFKKNENISNLTELMEISMDLDMKYKEVQETIVLKQKQIENEKEKANEMYNADALTDNPGMLNNLIAGFTSAFGIKQSDIDKMDNDLKKENDENKNKNNANGVTTIGFGNNNNAKQDDSNEIINEITVISKKSSKKRKAEEVDLENKVPELKKRKIQC